MFNWLHRLTSFLQSQISDPLIFMLHTFWTCQLSWSTWSCHALKYPRQQHTTLFTPHFNVSGAFLTCCVAARRWAHTCTTVFYHHKRTGCGSGATALSSSISLQDPFTLCKSDITLSHLSYRFLSSRWIHTCVAHTFGNPQHAPFSVEKPESIRLRERL